MRKRRFGFPVCIWQPPKRAEIQNVFHEILFKKYPNVDGKKKKQTNKEKISRYPARQIFKP